MLDKLLIVDDEPSIQKILERFLSSDYTITTKNDGKEALEWLQQSNDVDLIIADLNMPLLDGYTFIQAIRSNGIKKDTPIIVLSGMDSSSDKIKCLDLGADDYIVKPFNPQEVKARVKNILRRTKK